MSGPTLMDHENAHGKKDEADHQKNKATVWLTSQPMGITGIPEPNFDNYLKNNGKGRCPTAL